MKDIGGDVKGVLALSPQSSTASQVINGVAVDRRGFESVKVVGEAGAATGSPTGVSVTFKLQHGTLSDSSDMTDVSGASAAATAVNTGVSVNSDLRPLNRYIRAVSTAALTGGTSPTIMVAAVINLGEATIVPTV